MQRPEFSFGYFKTLSPEVIKNAVDSFRQAIRVKDLGDTSIQAIADIRKRKMEILTKGKWWP